MNRCRSVRLFDLCALSLLVLTSCALGEDPTPPSPAPAIDWGILLIPVITPILIAFVKVFLPRIPGSVLPIVAPLLGSMLDALMTYAGSGGGSPLLGAVLGSAGVGLREIIDQLKKQAGYTSTSTTRTVPALALVAAISALLTSGCGTPQRADYQFTGATVVTVDAAMNGWGDYVRAGKATAADEDKVRSAYTKYQAVMRTARSGTLAYIDSGATDKSEFDRAMAALDAAKNDLISLIQELSHPSR